MRSKEEPEAAVNSGNTESQSAEQACLPGNINRKEYSLVPRA
jgi:hypothetical protein